MAKPKAKTGQTWKRKCHPTSTKITIDDYDDDANPAHVNVRCRCDVTKNTTSMSLAFLLKNYTLEGKETDA